MSTDVPPRMAHLKRDPRGYPIPVGVYVDDTGRPHFTINNEPLRQRHMHHGICPICGTRLFRGRWFVGGPGAAFSELGAYIDPPMHAECARYSLRRCPFLAAPSYARRIEDRTLPKDHRTPILIEEECRDARPELFVAVMATAQEPIYWNATTRVIRFIRPRRPFSRVEYWRHGREISEAEARPLVERHMREIERSIEQRAS